jgi:hypothetical protein|tara:strand:- start:2524 stop:2694 length:171 start_codon:yes stop_codon:yes gene_type:complete
MFLSSATIANLRNRSIPGIILMTADGWRLLRWRILYSSPLVVSKNLRSLSGVRFNR